MTWYIKAAQLGDPTAKANVGFIYQKGLGTTQQNYQLAEKWYLESANGGFAEAQFNLAILYAQGVGVTQDLFKSLVWTGIYLNQENIMKHEQATILKNKLLAALSLDKIQAAEQKVSSWSPRPATVNN